jgi:hypothetical protein
LKRHYTPRQKLGVKYEQKVHERLEETYGLFYFPEQWFIYCVGERTKYCQVDGLLVSPKQKQITIVEVKYNHTSDAFWQMENLYVPVLQTWMRAKDWKVGTVEVVKWYDPSTKCPSRPVLRESLDTVKPGEFAVHILNR